MAPWHIDVIEDMTADLEGSLSNLGADLASGSYNMRFKKVFPFCGNYITAFPVEWFFFCLILSEALLSLPSLTVFKQETISPSQENLLNVAQSNSHQISVEVQDHASSLHRLLQQNNSHGGLKRIMSNGSTKICDMSDKKNEDCRWAKESKQLGRQIIPAP